MELINRPDDAPKDSRGASADTGKYLQAVALAGQLGKTVEEVLAFMGTQTPVQIPVNEVLQTKTVPLPILEETVEVTAEAKIAVPKEVPQEDKFVVTEIVNLEDASEADLDKLAKEEEDEEQDWSGKIRLGSRVKIVYQVSASRINWIGKRGKVVRIVGNESAKVYDVEFSGGKVQKIRLNKKTGKLERGYEKRVIRNTFAEDQVALDD